MDINWSIRIGLLAFLYVNYLFFRYILKNRTKYTRIAENRTINTIEVISYNFCCYFSVGIIPSHSSNGIVKLTNFDEFIIFQMIGAIWLLFGLYLTVMTLKQRNSIGIQKTPSGLIVSGAYQFARHPIYLGIILISGGLGFLFINFDGILIFPLIILVNYLEGKTEEIYDLHTRFGRDYQNYKIKVPILGPKWIWVSIFTTILLFLIL